MGAPRSPFEFERCFTMRRYCFFFCFLCYLMVPAVAVSAASKPNIIFFLVDDMGWMDCGAYGSQYYKTPSIDKLATQGMRFTDAYAMPLCSPTRASIMIGQHTARHGITAPWGHQQPQKAFLPETAPANQPMILPESGSYLDPSYITLANVLQDAGYRTAHIGKWHLGLTQPHWPENQGFDVAFHAQPSPGPPKYFSPYGVVPTADQINRREGKTHAGTITDGPPGEYITDRLTDEAIKFIAANKDRPFFLNLWHYGVHGPWGHKEEYTKEYAKTTDPRGFQGNPIMGSMLQSVDESLGRITAELDRLNLADNTVLIFYSDNGGNVFSMVKDTPNRSEQIDDWRRWAGHQPPTNNAPLREGKGRMYEGGVRVPLIVRWPGKIAAGTTNASIVSCIDMFPTILELVGASLPKEQKVDGLSFAPVLLKNAVFPRDTYFCWFPHLISGVSVRKGNWKLIRRFVERPDDYEGLHELFNLKDDLGETTNLASKLPDKVKELDALIDEFVRDTGALYPKPNPDYKPRPKVSPLMTSEQKPTTFDGLVARFCKVSPIDGAIRVEAEGRNPFLGASLGKMVGPLTLTLRYKTPSGGTGKVQWKTVDQPEFPLEGQTVEFPMLTGDQWKQTEVEIPIKGETGTIRLYLPATNGPVDLALIQYRNKAGKAKTWGNGQ